jgi:hypothetical protein
MILLKSSNPRQTPAASYPPSQQTMPEMQSFKASKIYITLFPVGMAPRPLIVTTHVRAGATIGASETPKKPD